MPGFGNTLGFVGAQSPDLYTPDTVQQHPLGMISDFVDPQFGYGTFVYAKASAAHAVGRLVRPDGSWNMADVANTANLGGGFAAAVGVMAINTFGWYRLSGQGPIQVNATVATGVAIGIAAAGIAGTNSAGKQLLNTWVLQSQTFAPTLANCVTQNLSKQVRVNDIRGLFPGLAVTGTGIPGATTIVSIDPSGNIITLNNAATATGTVTLTFTWTGFSWVWLNNAFTQGAIT